MSTRLSTLLLFFSFFSLSQNEFTISGSVYESEGQETLIGANIIFPELNTGTITNEYGFYSITLPSGVYRLTISYLGSVSYTHLTLPTIE